MRRYDAIVASSVDRLGRAARDLDELKNWATDNGKKLVVLKPDLAWPVASGTSGAAHRTGRLSARLAKFTSCLDRCRRDAAIGRSRWPPGPAIDGRDHWWSAQPISPSDRSLP